MRKASNTLVNLEKQIQDTFRANLKVMPEQEAKDKLKEDLAAYITKLKRNKIVPMDYNPDFEIVFTPNNSFTVTFN